jgi:hypothetical protein
MTTVTRTSGFRCDVLGTEAVSVRRKPSASRRERSSRLSPPAAGYRRVVSIFIQAKKAALRPLNFFVEAVPPVFNYI